MSLQSSRCGMVDQIFGPPLLPSTVQLNRSTGIQRLRAIRSLNYEGCRPLRDVAIDGLWNDAKDGARIRRIHMSRQTLNYPSRKLVYVPASLGGIVQWTNQSRISSRPRHEALGIPVVRPESDRRKKKPM